MQHFHVFHVKYLGATDTRGSRVKVISDRTKTSFTFGYNHALNNIEDMAVKELQALGYHIVGIAEGYVISDSFMPIK